MKEFGKMLSYFLLVTFLVVAVTLVAKNIQLKRQIEALDEESLKTEIGEIAPKKEETEEDGVNGGASMPVSSPSPPPKPVEIIKPRHYPETHEEMLNFLRTDKPDEEYLSMWVYDLAWWEDENGNIVERLKPGQKYTAHFFIYIPSDHEEVLTGARMGIASAESIMLGSCYAFPGEPDPFNDIFAYVWLHEYCLNPCSATEEALKLTIDKESFTIRQAYGEKAWHLNAEQVDFLLTGGAIEIGSEEMDGKFKTARENALEFSFEVSTSKEGVPSPVMFIRDDKKIGLYDYLNANILDRWSFLETSEEETQEIIDAFGWKSPYWVTD